MGNVATLAVALVAQHEAFTAGMNMGADAVKGFERTHLSLKSVMESITTPTERYEKQVEQLNKWMEIGKITTEQYQRALGNAMKTMEDAGRAGHEAGGGLEHMMEAGKDLAVELLPAISAAEAITKVFEGVKQGFEQVGEIGRASIRIGISPEEFSRLKYAAEVSHVSAETMEADMSKMLNAIEKASTGASKELPAVFHRLHLSIEELKDAEPAEAFERIGEAIAHVTNRAERMNDVREIFGRAGTAILPMLENMHALEAESDRVGFTRMAEDIERVEAAEKEWAKTTKQVEAAFMDLGAAAAPAIEAISTKILHAIEGARALHEALNYQGNAEKELKAAAAERDSARKAIGEIDKAGRNTEVGFAPQIALEEQRVEALKKEHEGLARLVQVYLDAGSEKGAAFFKAQEVQSAEEIAGFKKDIEERKAALKEYGEYLDEVLGGEGGEGKVKHKKQTTTQIANTISQSLYGLSIREYEEQGREAAAAFRKGLEEVDRLAKKDETPFEKEVTALQKLNDLYGAGAIEYDKYIKAREGAIKEYDAAMQRESDHTQRQTDELNKSAIKELHGEGDFEKRGRRHENAATSYNPSLIDPRAQKDDAKDFHTKQLGLSEKIVQLMNDFLPKLPSVTD